MRDLCEFHIRIIYLVMMKHNISPKFISEIFTQSDSAYNLRHSSDFKRTKVNTVLWGSEALRYIGPIIWDLLPLNIKTIHTLTSFISKVKNWVPINFPCRLCRDYIPSIGFLWILLYLSLISMFLILYADFIPFVCFTSFYLCFPILYMKLYKRYGFKIYL